MAASSSMETIKAHTAAVWSLHIRPDGKGFVTGSADKDIKFFDFEVRETAAEQGEDGEVRSHFSTSLGLKDDVRTASTADASPDGHARPNAQDD